MAERHPLPVANGTSYDASDCKRSSVVVRLYGRNQHLKGPVRLTTRRRDVFDNRLEQGPQIRERLLERARALAIPSDRVDYRELDLAFCRVEIDEQVENLVEYFFGPRVLAVDFVDDDDGGEFQFQRLRQHEASLGEWALGGIDEQHDAVNHPERPFHFTAKVGVTGRVHNVDLDVSVPDGRIFGHDRDAFFPFEIHRVHDALSHGLVCAKYPALPQHGVDERGFAMIDVCDYGDITQIHSVSVPSSVVSPIPDSDTVAFHRAQTRDFG